MGTESTTLSICSGDNPLNTPISSRGITEARQVRHNDVSWSYATFNLHRSRNKRASDVSPPSTPLPWLLSYITTTESEDQVVPLLLCSSEKSVLTTCGLVSLYDDSNIHEFHILPDSPVIYHFRHTVHLCYRTKG